MNPTPTIDKEPNLLHYQAKRYSPSHLMTQRIPLKVVYLSNKSKINPQQRLLRSAC